MKTILLTSSLLIPLLAALGPLLRGRIKPQVQYALWLLVALRLLIPVNLGSSALSALAVLDRIEQPPVLERISQTPISIRSYDSTYREIAGEYRRRGADPDTLPAGDLANLEAQARALAEEVPLSELVVRWAKPLWLGGAAAMGAWFLAVNGLFRRRLRRSAVPVPTECPLPVYVSGGLTSPCLSGFFRPAVYVTPAALEDPTRLRHVLAHEETHYRHKDHWWAVLRCLCLCLYWFNPLVWWAASLSRRDCELACDAGAIRHLGEGERFAYGRTLVDMIAAGRTTLLQTATTMTGGKRRVHQRVTLIARRPRTAAAAAAALALVLALAVGCSFTAPPEEPARTLGEELLDLPEELAEDVRAASGAAVPGVLAAYWLNLEKEEAEWGGWLLTVYELDQGYFEEFFIDNMDGSGWICGAKTGGLYYAVQFPTDVNFPLEKEEQYHKAQSTLINWVWDTILAREGTEEFDCDAYLSQPYFRSGCNYMDVIYWPYKAVNGSTDVVWTLRLVQPVTQGEGGVWGVERIIYNDGQSQPIRPRVSDPLSSGKQEHLSADDYYKRLQGRADAGLADWAIDPVEMLRRFVSEVFFHADVPADSFSLGETVTAWGPEEAPGEAVPSQWEGLSSQAIDFGQLAERITEAASPVFTYVPAVGDTVRCTASLERGNGRNRVLYFPRTFQFQPESAPSAAPEGASLTLESADGTTALQMWEGSELLRVYDGGESRWYLAVCTDPEDDIFRQDLFGFWRLWFDEAEIETLTDGIAIPNRGQSQEEIAQAWVDAYEGAKTQVSSGSTYACTYVRNTAETEDLSWLAPEDMDDFFPANTKGYERFAFSYQTVFVPENEQCAHWLMAGNTGEYSGNDAPAGAMEYFCCGYMYLTEQGWRCDGVGTGW